MSEQELIFQRRQQLVDQVYGRKGTIRDLAKTLNLPETTLYADWNSRSHWLGDFVHSDEMQEQVDDLICNFRACIDQCWDMARRYDSDGAKSQANIAMKNVRESLSCMGELLQSMGYLPKKAIQYEVDQKIEKVEVKASESDIDYLNKAANILNKAGGSQKRPENLH